VLTIGHILQYKLGLVRRVNDGQPTVKRLELQADFFAGYFSGTRKLERPGFPAAVFALTQYNAGDDKVSDPEHHGTNDERGAAVSRGFESAYRQRQSLSDAIEASVAYVSRL
jgi:predicted metalloprotease